MRMHLLAAILAAAATGCAAAPEPTATDYFPVTPEGYWIFEGTSGEQLLRAGIRGEGAADGGGVKLTLAWQPGGNMAAKVRLRDGFLVLDADGSELRLLPEFPRQVREWTWDNNGEAYRGRVVTASHFVAVPGGRFADVLVVELGPVPKSAGAKTEQWRWFFAPGVGPVKQQARGGATNVTLKLTAREAGGPVADLRPAPANG